MSVYVVGFAFSPNLQQVMLMEKKRPRWQAGYLNGPGGEVEVSESLVEAMTREFKEETGLLTHEDEWVRFASLEDRGNHVHFYHHVFVGCMPDPVTTTDEVVVVVPTLPSPRWLHNLMWLIPMAVNHINKSDPTEVFDIICLPRDIGSRS